MRTAIIDSDVRADLIRQKAYELYLKHGATHGHDISDWLAAEKIVDTELTEGRNLPESEREITRTSRRAPERTSAPEGVFPLRSSTSYKRASD